MEVAKFYCYDEIGDIPITTGGVPLPTGSAYIVSGVYTLGGQSHDCTRPGLYVWRVGVNDVYTHRICVGPSSSFDVLGTISGMCWNHVHGVEDEYSDTQAMSNKGRYHPWRLRCGYIAGLAAWLLPQLGVQARTVNVIQSGTPSVSFDYGHIVLEFYEGGQWRMVDMTNGCYWKDSNGNHMSTAQFVAQIANNGPMPEKVMLDGNDRRWQVSIATVNGLPLNLGRYGEEVASQESWMRRVFQVIV